MAVVLICLCPASFCTTARSAPASSRLVTKLRLRSWHEKRSTLAARARFISIWAMPSQVRRLRTRWPDLVTGKNIGPGTIPRTRSQRSRTVRVSSTTYAVRASLPLPLIVSTPSPESKSATSNRTSSGFSHPLLHCILGHRDDILEFGLGIQPLRSRCCALLGRPAWEFPLALPVAVGKFRFATVPRFLAHAASSIPEVRRRSSRPLPDSLCSP